MPAGRSADPSGDGRTRRELLVAAGVAGSVAVVGCLGVVGDEPSDTTHSDDDVSGGSDATTDDGDATTDDGDAAHGPTQPIDVAVGEPATEATVSMRGDHANRFAPQLVWIHAGGRVVWHNDDPDHDHDVASLSGRTPETAPDWSTGLLQTGETYTRTFTEPGVYDYVCTPHASHMVGRVVVGSPDPEDEPAISAAVDTLDGEEARAVFAVLDDRTRSSLGGDRPEAADEPDCDCPE